VDFQLTILFVSELSPQWIFILQWIFNPPPHAITAVLIDYLWFFGGFPCTKNAPLHLQTPSSTPHNQFTITHDRLRFRDTSYNNYLRLFGSLDRPLSAYVLPRSMIQHRLCKFFLIFSHSYTENSSHVCPAGFIDVSSIRFGSRIECKRQVLILLY